MSEELVVRAGERYAAGDFPSAKELIDEALGLDAEWPLMGHTLHAAGIIYGVLELRAEAVRFWTAFLGGAEHMPRRKVAEGHFNLGLCYRMLKGYDNAIHSYTEAAAVFAEIGNTALHAASLHNLAWAACLNGDASTAQSALATATTLRESFTTADHEHQVVGETFVSFLSNRPDALNSAKALFTATDATVRQQARWLAGTILLNMGKPVEAAAIVREGDVSPRMRVDYDALEMAIAQAG